MIVILSMTGYGNAKAEVSGKSISVEIKSVNSRYLDITCKMPKVYLKLEDKIKSTINNYATRGKIELYITVEALPDSEDAFMTVNHEYLKNYLSCLNILATEYNLPNDISVCRIASNRDIFTFAKPEEDDNILWQQLEGVLNEALSKFRTMKEVEGRKLTDDISQKLCGIEGIISEIELLSPETLKAHRERLETRIREFTSSLQIDEARLLTEIGIFADKIAIDEELVRLRSHFSQFKKLLSDKTFSPYGRKIDFLLQEINREINTIGSKANDASVAHHVVEAKSEVEKVREQCQNLE